MLKRWATALLVLAACHANAAPLQVYLPEIIPLSFITPTGQRIGLYVDLVTAIAQEANMELEFHITPFARSVNMMNSGNADLAVHNTSVVQSAKLRNLGTIHTTDLVLWPSPDKTIKHKSELSGQIVGRLRGGCQDVFVTNTVQFYEINDYIQGVRMLAAQRINALCGSREAITLAIRRNALSTLETKQPLLLKSMQIALFARKNLPKTQLDRLQRARKKIMASELPQELASRYGLK